jgi:hypothetical protein
MVSLDVVDSLPLQGFGAVQRVGVSLICLSGTQLGNAERPDCRRVTNPYNHRRLGHKVYQTEAPIFLSYQISGTKHSLLFGLFVATNV